MAKKFKYTPVSIFAAICGTVATAVASTNPVTAPFAVKIGTTASAVAGGFELNDEEKNIKENLVIALDSAWDKIARTYRLYDSPNCLSELKTEVMGENTSVDEFIRNIKSNGLEPSIALLMQGILEKHKSLLNKDPAILWTDEFIEIAAKEMASILVGSIKSVLEKDDQLKILKAISDSEDRIIKRIKESESCLIEEIQRNKSIPTNAPISLSAIPPTVDLIGRENDIQTIQGLLDEHNIVSIHADGGVGKTAVVAKIINQIKDVIVSGNSSYEHVAWITSTGDLKNDLIGLNIPLVDTMKSPEEKHKIVSTYLQNNPTLLVIDNMDEPPSREDSYILNTIVGHTKLLITTRAEVPYAKEYLLGNLDPDSALVLLYWHFTRKQLTINQINERKDYPYGEKIVRATAQNALFIELIGKMAYAEHWKLGTLWEKLSVDVFGINSKHPIFATHGEDGKLLEHIQKLYEMSGLSEKQKEIMLFMTLFPPEYSIFFDVFEWAGFENDEEDNLRALQDRGWISRDDEGYLIHTLVKGSIELQGLTVFSENRYEALIKELINVEQYIHSDMVYTMIRERIIVPKTICKLMANNGTKKILTSTLQKKLANVLYEQGQYKESLSYYKEALDIQKELLGPDHPKIATLYNEMARVYQDQLNYEEALKCCNQAFGISEKLFTQVYSNKTVGINEKMFAQACALSVMTFNNMGCIQQALGNYNEAIVFFEKSLVFIENMMGSDQLATAKAYNNIAMAYQSLGYTREALNYYHEALAIKKKQLGEEHPTLSATYNNLADLYNKQGQYEEALKYFQKDLLICEKYLGIEHPSTATTYSNIGLLYSNLGNYEEAFKYIHKALDISKKALGPENPSTLLICSNLAALYQAKGEYEESLANYTYVLGVIEKTMGRDHPSLKSLYNNIGRIYQILGNYEESLVYFQRGLEICLKNDGDNNSDTADLYSNIASVYIGMVKNSSRKKEYLSRSMAFYGH